MTAIELSKDDLELIHSGELKALVKKEILNNKNIALDLVNIGSVNSSGLGILISCLKLVKENQGNFRLLNVNDKIRKIFNITKLYLIFDLD
jgi:anti-sigma B factor antagonist